VTRRVFPLAEIVTTADPGSPEWFAARRGGITATDVVAVLGLSGHANTLSVWHDKRGELPDDDAGEAALWGHLLEDPVAREWARRRGVRLHRVGVAARRDASWMRASVDRKVLGCPLKRLGPCIVEIKTRSAFTRGQWRDGVPDDVLAQVIWQLLVTGAEHAHVAVLVGGQQLLDPPAIRVADEIEVAELIQSEALAAWEAVVDGRPPEVDAGAALLSLLDRLHPARDGAHEVPVDDLDDTATALAGYVAAGDAERDAKAAKEAAKARLVQRLGPAETAVHPVTAQPLWTYRRPRPAQHADPALIRDVVDDATWVSLLEAGAVTTVQQGPRIHITKAGRELAATETGDTDATADAA
jgi:putative phage-type endonuclease